MNGYILTAYGVFFFTLIALSVYLWIKRRAVTQQLKDLEHPDISSS